MTKPLSNDLRLRAVEAVAAGDELSCCDRSVQVGALDGGEVDAPMA